MRPTLSDVMMEIEDLLQSTDLSKRDIAEQLNVPFEWVRGVWNDICTPPVEPDYPDGYEDPNYVVTGCQNWDW